MDILENYTVVSIRYKYGEFDFYNASTEEHLRKYLLNNLKEECEVNVDDDIEIGDLIELSLTEGLRMLNNQEGWGVIAITQGSTYVHNGTYIQHDEIC